MSSLNLKRNSACCSELQLERAQSEDLTPAERAALEAHFAGCASCQARYSQMRAQRESFLARAPSWDAFLEARKDQPSTPTTARTARDRAWLRWAGVASLAVAAAALLGSRALLAPRAERSKGAPHLSVWLKRGQRVSRAESGEPVRPGELLRIAYSSAVACELALIHRDAHTVTVFFPDQARTQPVAAGREVPLNFSIELDAELGIEHLYGVFCEQPTSLAPLIAALERDAEVEAPPHCQIEHVTLPKRAEGP